MARSCGIRIGLRRVDVVLLDGSAKKPKVLFSTSRELAPGEDPLDVLRDISGQRKLPGDNVGLVIDGGLGAYRMLTLPFDDRAKIEQVIKYEVESELPQWNIDDVVVDFHPIRSTGVETVSLVTAVPKDVVSEALALATRVGLEPLEAELDGTALVNAAEFAGQVGPESGSVLVYVGEHSTTVAVVVDGAVKSMRAFQVGALAREDAPAPAPAEGAETTGEAEPAEAQATAPVLDPEVRFASLRRRLEREIASTVAGSTQSERIEVVLMSGYDIPGLAENIADVPVERLRLFPEEEGEDEDISVPAFGAALRQLGGGIMRPSLRREELRYSGKLERLEMPLAVLIITIFFFLFVDILVMNKKLGWRDTPYIKLPIGEASEEQLSDLQIWMKTSNSYLLKKNLTDAPDSVRKYAKDAEAGLDEDRSKFEQLLQIRTRLRIAREDLDRELGHDADILQPQSALEGLSQVLGVLEELGDGVGRFSVRKLSSSYVLGGARDRGDTVLVKLHLSFFADGTVEASRNYRNFKNTLDEKSWVIEVPDRGTDTLEGGQGIYVDNFQVVVDTTKIQRGRL